VHLPVRLRADGGGRRCAFLNPPYALCSRLLLAGPVERARQRARRRRLHVRAGAAERPIARHGEARRAARVYVGGAAQHLARGARGAPA